MTEIEGFDATRRICEFVVSYDATSASPLLRRRATDLIIDTFAVAVAASCHEVGHALVGLGRAPSGGAVTIIGQGPTTDAGFAAFYNGALAHALEYDDSTLNPVGHPSCIIVPALFAQAEVQWASGRDFLEAYLVGLEVHSRLGQAEAGGWSSAGAWLPIGHVSLMGAAAACAKLLKLDQAATEHALGFAAHFCGGLGASNGSLAKPIGAGVSARAGLEAALLARAGATAARQVIERPQGFADVFLGRGHDLPKALGRLGAPHHLEEVGIAIKRYPSCYATHWGVDALLLLLSEHGIAATDIATISLDHPAAGAFCDNPDPGNTEEARFSHEYNLAVAALDGLPGPASYTTQRLARPDVRAMLSRVRTRNHPEGLAPPKAWEYLVTVTTTSGQTVSRAVPRPLGHPRHPMGEADLRAKFLTCAEPALGGDGATRLLAALSDLADLPDLRPVSRALADLHLAYS